jgi:hypothetical protein
VTLKTGCGRDRYSCIRVKQVPKDDKTGFYPIKFKDFPYTPEFVSFIILKSNRIFFMILHYLDTFLLHHFKTLPCLAKKQHLQRA